MKKLFLLFALFLGIFAVSVAQDFDDDDDNERSKKTPQERAELQTKRWTEKLGLSADQTAKVREATLNRITKADAVRQKKLPKPQQNQELKPIRAEFNEQMKVILTPDQFAKYEQLKDDKKDKIKENRGKGQGRGNGKGRGNGNGNNG